MVTFINHREENPERSRRTPSQKTPRRPHSAIQEHQETRKAEPPESYQPRKPRTESKPAASEPRRAEPRRRTEVKPVPAPAQVVPPVAETSPSSWNPADYAVEPAEGKTRFQDITISELLLHAIADLGWKYCTPIQAAILPNALQGRDCTGKAQTGTGKTAAFLITLLTHLIRRPMSIEQRNGAPRALILAPTRELVQQIEKDAQALAKYTSIHALAIYGGSSYHHQREALAKYSPEIIIATPGRLIDLMRQQTLHLNHCEWLVIDEADRMLDMGFIPDVRSIIHRTPPRAKRHTLFFSATLTGDVIRLASQWLNDPVTVEIEPEHVAVETVNQRVYIVENCKKIALVYNIMQRENPDQILIFANRRDSVFDLNERLQQMGISCSMISGALPQNRRERTLEDFKEKKIRVLIATDVAGRGLHISGISHVINYNLPTDPEDYVHRIGRTGRAGASGTSISFACEDDSFYLADIEKYIGRSLPCEQPDDAWLELPEGMHTEPRKRAAYRQVRSGDRRGPPRRAGGGRRPPRSGTRQRT